MAELQGHVVVLHFWAHSSIESLYPLPVLQALEERRRREPVAVLGVHSPRYRGERGVDAVSAAVAHHGVTYPVLVDRDRLVARAFGVRASPALVVVRPDGSVGAVVPGEPELDALDAFVGTLLDEGWKEKTLATTPIVLDRPEPASPGYLCFPGKVVTLPGERLAVSDTGNHRVLVCDRDGAVESIIGSGRPGFVDGPLAYARFHAPQGLAVDGHVLFVADSGNHAVREIDLRATSVRTVAGTGRLGRGAPPAPAPALEVDLRSPWDLAVANGFLLVAMAGSHQIWALVRDNERIAPLAGTGSATSADGAFEVASFAQPTGLARAGSFLYVADSEGSAVRVLDMETGSARTLVGHGGPDFGDLDGPAQSARLQFPTGISWGPAGLLVADTFNHKLRRVDEQTGAVTTFFVHDSLVDLREPSGLCQLPDGEVIVADTNHHRLIRVSKNGLSGEVLRLSRAPGLETHHP